MTEKEQKQFTVIELGPTGIGNPDAHISAAKMRAQYEQEGKLELFERMSARMGEILKSGEALVPVTRKAAGCMDGRSPMGSVTHTEEGEKIIVPFSEGEALGEWSKLAGGAYVGAQMMRLGAINEHGEFAHDDIRTIATELHEDGEEPIVGCAHTAGGNTTGHGTGCLGNDAEEAVAELAASEPYADAVEGVTTDYVVYAGGSFDTDEYQKGLGRWTSAREDAQYFKESSGETRLRVIEELQEEHNLTADSLEDVATTFELEGGHKEIAEAHNFKAGWTIDQKVIRDLMHESFPEVPLEELPQVFVLDHAYIQELSEKAAKGNAHGAFQMGVAYQVAALMAITDGSLDRFIYQ